MFIEDQLCASYWIKSWITEMTDKVAQWLRLCAPSAGGLGSILGQETRSHMPQLKIPHTAMKIKDPACPN